MSTTYSGDNLSSFLEFSIMLIICYFDQCAVVVYALICISLITEEFDHPVLAFCLVFLSYAISVSFSFLYSV